MMHSLETALALSETLSEVIIEFENLITGGLNFY